jgi:adenosylmethionine-8-amino-7-oxononanoate aminotransferase
MATISQRRSDEAQAIVAAHLDHILLPERRAVDEALVFRSANGIRLTDVDGNEWLDVAAGLVNVNIGYGREELAEAAAKAMRELSYTNPFYGRGSVTGAQLAAKLAQITPPGIERFFFTTGGSDANDTAIKLARYYNTRRGKPEKIHIIGRVKSFHGGTVGAWSMTGSEMTRAGFGPPLPGFSHIAQPGPEVGAETLEQEILRVGPDKVAMFLAEPISTPPRVNIPPDDYWPAMREICTKYDVLLSFDEVITGFGRTGKMFAAEHWNVAPDLMQMSKGITSGYLPLGAVGLTEAIAEVIDSGGELHHGFTTGGHTVSCAVALANIAIMEDEHLIERSAAVHERLRAILQERLVGGGFFCTVRGIGSLSVIDVDPEVPDEVRRGLDKAVMDQRLLVRNYGDWRTVGFAPSLSMTDADVDEVVARVAAAVAQLDA